MTTPCISIGSLGGTISMTSNSLDPGVTPTLHADDLVQSVPGLDKIATITTASLFQVPSAHLSFKNMIEVVTWAKKEVESGAAGVVITQGTDTIEESAFFCDLLWDCDAPLVIMGAMRPPQYAGADGPSNLLASVITAASIQSRNRGVLVVMNDRIHQAKWVRKNHTAFVQAFTSHPMGACGVVFEQQAHYFTLPLPRITFAIPHDVEQKVFLWEQVVDAGGDILSDLPQKGYSGLVLSGFGAGHVSKEVATITRALVKTMPIVLSSRIGNGSTAYNTYGFYGSEIDMQSIGVMMSGWLCPRKARILLWIILSNQLPRQQFTDYIESLSIV